MLSLPPYVSLIFGLTVLFTLGIFHIALIPTVGQQKARLITTVLVLWTVVQSVLTFGGFYRQDLDKLPPRFLLAVGPMLLAIILLFVLPRGRRFVDRLPLVPLTYLHTVRVPVELTLYWLYLYNTVPELMTFSGRNFDILAGLTAPFVAYFGLQRGKLGRAALLTWNVVALGLVLFIVVNAVLSTPTPLQRFAFDQPNVAIFYFPFILLPAVVVPLVLFSHLVSLRRLATTQFSSSDSTRRNGFV